MNGIIDQLCLDLDKQTKRQRGQTVPMQTKLSIVRELLRQRQAKKQQILNKKEKTNQTEIARRYSVAQSTVSKINKLLKQLLLVVEANQHNNNNNNDNNTMMGRNLLILRKF